MSGAAVLAAKELALELTFGSAADWLKSNLWVFGDFLVWRWSSVIIAGAVLAGVWLWGEMRERRGLPIATEGLATPAMRTADAEKGLLDFIPDGQKAMEDFARSMVRVSKSTSELRPKLSKHTKRMEGAGDNPNRRRRIASDAARDMDRHSAVLEENVRPLQDTANGFATNYIGYLELVSPTSEEEMAALRTFRGQIDHLMTATREARQSAGGYRNSVAGLRERRLSQDLNVASDRLSGALDNVADVMKGVEHSLRKMLTLIDRHLQPKGLGTSRKKVPPSRGA